MKPCKCGSENLEVQDWYNRKLETEYFVRCLDCREPGPVAKTEDEAKVKWEAQ